MNILPDYKIKQAEKTVAAFRKALLRFLARGSAETTVYRITTNNGGVRGMTEHHETARSAIKL